MQIAKTGTVTIASGQTTSGAIDLTDQEKLLAVTIPAEFTGTTITFTASVDGSTYLPVYYEGTQYSVSVGTSRFIALDPRVFASANYVRIVSGSSEGAGRSVGIVVRAVA
jgi:hypothetical protein